jgi:exosome complex RNA-binding protein Csl4
MSTAITMMASTLAPRRPLVDVRCRPCGKLLFRWRYTGLAEIEVRCTRCGNTELRSLST